VFELNFEVKLSKLVLSKLVCSKSVTLPRLLSFEFSSFPKEWIRFGALIRINFKCYQWGPALCSQSHYFWLKIKIKIDPINYSFTHIFCANKNIQCTKNFMKSYLIHSFTIFPCLIFIIIFVLLIQFWEC